jgi:hypothetical protein
VLVDHRRLDEARAAVDDAVADRVGRNVVVDLDRRPVFDEVPLEARGAGVDGEDLQRERWNGGYSSRISSA